MRVLIVDDQEYIRRGLRAILLDEPGVEICGEAVNGSEAIDMAQDLHPDVIIMDISMPILDGFYATRIIRQILPSTEVITLSQYEIDDPKDLLNAGARIHVTKLDLWDKLLPALRCLQRPSSGKPFLGTV